MIADSQIGKRYAEAIFEIAESNNSVKNVYEALNSLMESYKTDKEFKNFIDHPLITNEEKIEALGKIYENENQEVKNIIFYILEKNRMANIREIVAEYLKIYYAKNQILDVEATFAKELTKEQRERLIHKLEIKIKKKINLVEKVDTSIIGGGILKIGDRIIDGTVRTQLDSLVKSL